MNKKGYWIIAVIIIIMAFSAYKACRITDEFSRLKGEYKILKKQFEQSKKEGRERIGGLEREIRQKDGEIEKYQAGIAEREKNLTEGKKKIASLEKERENLKDKDEIIANLETQVRQWAEQFSTCQDIIAEKDKIIFSLTGKYEAQVKISAEYKANWEGEHTLRVMAEKQLRLAERHLIEARFWSNVKTAAIITTGTYILAEILLGGK